LGEVVGKYVQHMRTIKTGKSAQTDTYYLRDVFGPICPAVEIISRKPSLAAKKRPLKPGQDRRHRPHVIAKSYFEDITTADVADFIGAQVRTRGLAPKTANRYREILCRLFNWSMEQGGVRMPNDRNPVEKVERYQEHAPEIRFLTLPQVDEQLAALADHPQLQTMVALYIYAGLRREEALWLTPKDVDLEAGVNGMIRVQAKTINGQHWQPKTEVNRAVPISQALRQYLEWYAPRPSEGHWYFPSPEGKWWDPDNLSKHLAKFNKQAGLVWTCLDFRHTFGSQLAQKGESLYKISQLMGNSPEICRRHYAALIPEAMADSVEFSPAPARQAPQPPPADQASPGRPRLRLVQADDEPQQPPKAATA
jgi:integrase